MVQIHFSEMKNKKSNIYEKYAIHYDLEDAIKHTFEIS